MMAHNIYVNIILSTDDEEFPKDFGLISEIKKELTLVVRKYENYKMRRYNFDIIGEEYDMEEDMEEDTESDQNAK